MGYETRMYVVARSQVAMKREIAFVDNRMVAVFRDKKDKAVYYERDGETKRDLPEDTQTVSAVWGDLIAMFDLSKCGLGPVGRVIDYSVVDLEKTDTYVYEPTDGNELIGEDRYGSFRRFVPIEEVIKALEEEVKDEEPYRRFVSALALLRSIKQEFTHEVLGCLFYGY